MISIFRKEIVGIYMENNVFHYCIAAKSFFSWKMATTLNSVEPKGVLNGSFPEMLREFLQIKPPASGRQFFVALPRNRFFIRDLQLPPLPVEDALMSIQNSLSVICHLPLDDIYYEILLLRLHDNSINALVIYALSKDISPIVNIFKETGHEKSLKGLFPLSLGIGAWLSLQEYSMPMALIIPQENHISELAVYSDKGCVFSLAHQKMKETDDFDSNADFICRKFSVSNDMIFSLSPDHGQPLFDPIHKKLGWLPPLEQNFGVAALSTGMSNHQQILLNGEAPRIKMFSIWKLFLTVVIALAVFLSLWTVKTNFAIESYYGEVRELENEIIQLQQNILPLEKAKESINKEESLFTDIDDFMRFRPLLYSCYNEIARLVPEGTWFSRSNFQGSELTLQGQSRDALKVVESLRTSVMFEQVKLAGSVSRAMAGMEQFSLTMRLKNVETNP